MKEKAVMYERAFEEVLSLPDEYKQLEALKGLLTYGFYGTLPTASSIDVAKIFKSWIPRMKDQQEKHDQFVSNGRMGGRPAGVPIETVMRMKRLGMTNREIAEIAGCSVKNIENRVSNYRKRVKISDVGNDKSQNATLDSGRYDNGHDKSTILCMFEIDTDRIFHN